MKEFILWKGRTVADTQPISDFLATLDTQKAWTVTIKQRQAKRTLSQNALVYKWYGEIAAARGDMTVEDVRAECKLVFGVPILREENERFREVYDRCLKSLPYEAKLDFIRITQLPITSIMTVDQEAKYMEKIIDMCRSQAIQITTPEYA